MGKFLVLIFCFVFIFQIFCAKSYSSESQFADRYNYHKYGDETIMTHDADEFKEVLFIVDFSNSMNNKIGYTPKIYHAIDAIKNVLNNSNDRTEIGLRIFGIVDGLSVYEYRNADKKTLCSASSLILPISQYNGDNISSRLMNIAPRGVSPIGYSLRQAVQNDFSPGSSLKHIILVTDGGENCGDDPCIFIKNLMRLRDDFKIDVIGITVDDNSYSQLNCIAQAGKGKYFSVNQPEDFQIMFKQAFDSSIKKKVNISSPVIKDAKIRTNPVNILNPEYNNGTKYKNFVYEFDY